MDIEQGHQSLNISVRKPIGNSRCLVYFFIIALFFAILSVVFFVLFLREVTSKKDVCISQDCMRISTRIYQSMDEAMDPCKDFYQYACGGWIKRNTIPESKSSVDVFILLGDQNIDLLRVLISQSSKVNRSVVFDHVTQFYQSCLRRNEVEKNLNFLIKSLLEEIGLGSPDKFVFWDIFWKIRQKMEISLMASIDIVVDRMNSSANIIMFDQPLTKLSRESYLNYSDHNNKTRDAYMKMMKDVFALLDIGLNSTDAERTFALERSLVEYSIPMADRRNIQAFYEKLTISRLASITGIELSVLIGGLNQLFSRLQGQRPVTENEIVASVSTKYITSAYTLIKNMDSRTLYAYFTWNIIFSIIELLPGEYEKVYDHYQRSTTGTNEKEPWWKTCLSQTETYFGWVVGRMFIDENFSLDSKRKIVDMVERIRDSFHSNIQRLSWMDEQTKMAAVKKLYAMSFQIGYPDWIQNDTELLSYYDKVKLMDNFFSSLMTMKTFIADKKLKGRGSAPSNNEWGLFPQTVNAMYNPSENKMIFPAGILQPPLYDEKAPMSLTFGGLGMIIGHEIAHAFDDEGKNYDSMGNLFKWWTNKSEENFRQKAECIVQQYSQFVAAGRKMNGLLTLGENIADNGGVQQAFQAFTRWKQENHRDMNLPSLGLYDQQLFYIGHAQIWCERARVEAIISMIETGYHLPSQFRVIGPLSNSEDFSRSFHCPRDSSMNPKLKCRVW